MHFTTSFLTGAMVALYATQIAAAPVSRSRNLLGARATEGCDGDPAHANDPDYYRCLSVPADPVKPTKPETDGDLIKPKTANPAPAAGAGATKPEVALAVPPKKQARRGGDELHTKRATEGCDGDPAHANDPDYYRCLSVPADPAKPKTDGDLTKPQTANLAPKDGKPVKLDTKVVAKQAKAEEAPATTPEKKPTPLDEATRNRLPVSQMEDGGRP